MTLEELLYAATDVVMAEDEALFERDEVEVAFETVEVETLLDAETEAEVEELS